MDLESKASPPGTDWRRLHAFGLPPGSVRALLALMVFASAWVLLVLRPAEAIPDFLRDLLFIILGHYFAARRAVAPGDEAGPPPLYLPRGSVRLALVVGSAAVAVVLLRRGQLTDIEGHPGAVTLVLIGGFLLGVALSAAFGCLRARGHRPPRLVEDLRAAASLAAAVALVTLVLGRAFDLLPSGSPGGIAWPAGPGGYGPEQVLAAIVGFYFGSRS